jgi:diguanylate cyclase (GGDEF)-like protein
MDPTDEVTPRGPSARLSIGIAAFGGLWLVLHAVGWLDPEAIFTFGVFAVLAVAGTVYGLHRYKPQPRWPWVAVLGAFALYLVGGVMRVGLGTLGDLSPDRSIVPDLVILPGYAIAAAAMAGLARAGRRGRDGDLDALLDAVVAGLAVLALAWVFLITPALAQDETPLSVRLLLASYPAASVFLFAMAVHMAFSVSRKPPIALRVLLLATLGMLIGDVVYMLVDTTMVTLPTHVIDVPYAAAFVAFTVAVVHPSAGRIGESFGPDGFAPRRSRLVLVAAALSVPAVVLLTPLALSSGTERLVLAGIVLVLTGLAALRMFRALHQHARSQQRLAHQATHDALTELPNRVFLHDHIVDLLCSPRVEAGTIAVLLLDLDRFKLVNDTMGHTVGDELLVAVADRLRANARSTDVIGRIGGDEFVIVASGLRDEQQALEFAERTRLVLHVPFVVRGAEIPVAASIGVSTHDPVESRSEAESLLRDADTAMYQAKARGGDTVVCFDSSMRERVAQRLMLERELRQALARGELEVHYQPKLRLSDRRVVGMEALLRWNHPVLGWVSPAEFIPIAEDTGMIVDIGAWVVDQACAELGRIHQLMARPEMMTVSVNLSVRQLRDDTMIDHVARALLRHRLSASALCLELTESMLMEDVDIISHQLAALRSCGVKISVDDFGTGYSSLAYLRRLPIDEVKIDLTFVHALDREGPGASMVAAVVAIADSLDITTVAEGVETEEQAEVLTGLGCLEAQGYLFSPPVPSHELVGVIKGIGSASGPRLRSVSS